MDSRRLFPFAPAKASTALLKGWTLATLLLAFSAAGRAGAGEWQTAIEDSFTVGADRPAGSPLAGSMTEKGERVWRTKGNAALFVLTPEGQVGNGNINGGKMVALLDCVPDAGYQEIKIEADIQPGAAQWLGMGFSKGDDLFWSKETPGQLWLVITKGGQAQIFANATATMLKGVKAEEYGFDPEKPVHAEILYNRPANAVTVTLNGQKVLDARALGDFQPDIKTAGIMDNFPQPNDPKMRLDNFTVSVRTGAAAQ
ncbi:MAG: hypothetical protein WC789_05760 [Lentisphaeria bacterium]|jgi:hypothetical protein